MRIAIINGPNLNMLGKREPSVYGTTSFESYFTDLRNEFADVVLDYFQSNHEGALIDHIQKAGFEYDGIILNAGAYTHTSVAIADAVRSVASPVVEVHISNIYKREAFRQHSYIAAAAAGTISGFGLHSYKLAVLSFLK